MGNIISIHVLSVEQKTNSETIGKNRGDAKQAHKNTFWGGFLCCSKIDGCIEKAKQKDPYAFIRQSNQPSIFHTVVSQILGSWDTLHPGWDPLFWHENPYLWVFQGMCEGWGHRIRQWWESSSPTRSCQGTTRDPRGCPSQRSKPSWKHIKIVLLKANFSRKSWSHDKLEIKVFIKSQSFPNFREFGHTDFCCTYWEKFSDTQFGQI